jgi:beta-glucosidase
MKKTFLPGYFYSHRDQVISRTMNSIFKLILIAGVSLVFIHCRPDHNRLLQYKNAELPIGKRVDDLISRMTMEEKIVQMVFWGKTDSFISNEGQFREETTRRLLKNGAGLVGFLKLTMAPEDYATITNQIQKIVVGETRLGIPALFFGEGLHGYMGKDATSFPIPPALASTWDTALVRQVFTVVAKEARAFGVTQLFTPVLDLGREPRWGRVEETYGEDPFLVSRMGLSAVLGLQGTSQMIGKEHVAATAKHFAGHGQPEGGTNISPANYSERVFRENFLYPFEIVVKKGHIKSVMASYNEIDGFPSHANPWLLRDILKNDWAFPGYVVGDLGGVEELYMVHQVAADSVEAARMALEAGVDLDLVKYNGCYRALPGLIKSGQVDQQILDEALRRVLTLKFELGLFEDPYTDVSQTPKIINTPEHKALAFKAAEEAVILLKNQHDLLPLDEAKIKNLAVIGPNAAEIHLGGYSAEPFHGVSVLEGIQKFAEGKFRVSYAEGCKITVQKGSFWEDGNAELNSYENDEKLIKEAVQVAKQSDVVFLVLGGNERTSREAWAENHRGDRDDLDLFGRQDDLAKAVLAAGKPVVALLLNGRPLSVRYLAENVSALLEGWFLGEETGNAIARILFGKVSPSGKLPFTIPRSVGQLPCYYNKKPSRFRSYIGESTPLFPFGFGLSYTSFEYRDIRLSPETISAGDTASVRISVKNTGKVEADEIVQLYIRDEVSSVTRPVKELKGFKKISLKPGEETEVTFSITPDLLEFYNREMERVVEAGDFILMAGTSSESYLKTKLTVK